MSNCQIHPEEEMFETHPADPENGPDPSDVENELACFACIFELQVAYDESLCLIHRIQLGHCMPCLLDTMAEV
jgi:hypothetical protein